jgi:hypothetical protein
MLLLPAGQKDFITEILDKTADPGSDGISLYSGKKVKAQHSKGGR